MDVLEDVVGLQLSIMQPSEADSCANIVKVSHSNWHEMCSADYNAMCLRWLIDEIQSNLVIVGKKACQIVAVYELPNFVKTETTLENSPSSFGWFATAIQSKGIGSAFMKRLGNIFAQCAYEAGVQRFVHREQATNSMNRRFFENNGYTVVGTFEGLRNTFYYCVRELGASSQTLSPLEHQVVGHISQNFQLKQSHNLVSV